MALPKKQAEKAVRMNITLPPIIFHAGQDLVRMDLYASFSDMLQGLIRDRYREHQKPVEPVKAP